MLEGYEGQTEEICNQNKTYDRIYINNLMVSSKIMLPEIKRLSIAEKTLVIPVQKYSQIINKMKHESYELKISIPQSTTNSQLTSALDYFPNYLKKDYLLQKMSDARQVGYLKVEDLFNEQAQLLLYQYDYESNWYCHTAALLFINPNLVKLGSPVVREFFKQLPINEKLKFGDILSFGNSHRKNQ